MSEFTREIGCLERADGSARLSRNGTTVLVQVNGPGEVRLKKELIDRAYIDVMLRPAIGVAGTKEKYAEQFIKNVLDSVVLAQLHPRTCIAVFVQIIEENGSVLATALNAVCMALLDAGIPLRTTFMAVECALAARKGADAPLLFYPTAEEEEAAVARFCLVYGHNIAGLLGVESLGAFTPSLLARASTAGSEQADQVLAFFRQAFTEKLSLELAPLVSMGDR